METQEITGQNGVTLKVNSLDGVAIIPVPSLRMKTEYAFKEAGGFAAKLFAGEMNWLIVGAGAAIAIEKHNNTKIIQAANSELYDADQLMGRLVHDCWLFDEQVDTCAVSLLETNAVDLAGATDRNGVVGFKDTELPALSNTEAAKVKITMGTGTEGVKWYFLKGTTSEPDKVNVGSALPDEAEVVTAAAEATVTKEVGGGNYGLLYGVKDGRVVIFDYIKAAVNKAALTDAIAAANTNKDTTEVSTDGTDVDPTNKWVTLEVMTAYENAIAAAQTIADKADATQTEVDDAVTALATATSTFDGAKADGKAGT
jgi:hypothetical protein